MLEEKLLEQETVTPTEKVEVENKVEEIKSVTPADKLHTQEELDKIVQTRLAREREAHKEKLSNIQSTLGVDSLDDLETFVSSYKEAQNKLSEREKVLQERDNQILLLRHGVKEDKSQEALALAKLKDDLSLGDALREVVAEYPNLKGGTAQFGKPSGKEPDVKPKPIYSKEYLVAMQHIPFYNNLLKEMEK